MKKIVLLSIFAAVCIISCKDMDLDYKEYLVPNGLIYPQKADSLKLYSGVGKVRLEWFVPIDPNIVRARIYWDNYIDSAEYTFPASLEGLTRIGTVIEGLKENTYTFDVRTYDAKGNVSVPSEITGQVYGSVYMSELRTQAVLPESYTDNAGWHVFLGDIDENAVATEIEHEATDGTVKTVSIPVSVKDTLIVGAKRQTTFKHRTFHMQNNYMEPVPSNYAEGTIPPMYTDLDRTEWTSTQSHNRPADSPSPTAHLDGDLLTFLSLRKPGRGSETPEGERLFFIIDMNETREVNYFRIRHRNETVGLRVWALSIYGSNDGVNFSEIRSNIAIPDVQNNAVLETPNIEIPDSYFRYIKVFYEEWDPVNNSAIQMSEFYLGIKN
jgi:hypothetical protein